MRLTRLLSGATAGATVLVLAGAGSALAATPSPTSTCSPEQLAYVQARVDLAVAHRQLTITSLTSALAARTHVTGAHRSTLSGLFSADASGLDAVNAKVHADTTCKQAVADGRTVVTGYRVYMLLAPQTHLVAAADTGTYGASRLTAVEPTLQAGVDAITDPTKKAQAQAVLDDLEAQTKTATDDFAGVGDAVLALVPEDMPAQQSTLSSEQAKVQSGRSALTTALKDAKTLKGML